LHACAEIAVERNIRSMALSDILLEICKLEKMKKTTPVMENVFHSAHRVLEILREGEFPYS